MHVVFLLLVTLRPCSCMWEGGEVWCGGSVHQGRTWAKKGRSPNFSRTPPPLNKTSFSFDLGHFKTEIPKIFFYSNNKIRKEEAALEVKRERRSGRSLVEWEPVPPFKKVPGGWIMNGEYFKEEVHINLEDNADITHCSMYIVSNGNSV